MICPQFPLLYYFDSVFKVLEPIADSTAYVTRRSLILFYEYVLAEATKNLDAELLTNTERHLEDIFVSSWVKSLHQRYKPKTVKGHRANLITVWNHAIEHRGFPAHGKIRTVKVPEPNPDAMDLDELARLIETAAIFPGQFLIGRGHRPSGYLVKTYFTAAIPIAYCSGLRTGDLLELPRSLFVIRQSGQVTWVQNKTGHTHTFYLDKSDAARVLALPGEFPLCPPGGLSAFYVWWRKLKTAAGITHKDAFKLIRRTGATWAENEKEGAASIYLGHRSATAWKNYVAMRKLRAKSVRPPSWK